MWKIKVLIQFFLSKLPMGERINYLLQRASNGPTENKMNKRIIPVLKVMEKINKYSPLKDSIVVEIGTGWYPIGSILLYLMGVKLCHTYDHVPHLRYNLTKRLIGCIKSKLGEISEITPFSLDVLEKRLLKLEKSSNLDDFLSNAGIIYYAPGDASRTGLEDKSVDLVYSQAVLEHVPKKLIYDLTMETKRILKSSGVAYHLIGMRDHYAGFDKKITQVNFLKYSEFWWSFFVKNKISYHNRLREKQFLDIFKKCGAKIIWLENERDPNDINILKNMKINKSFHGMSYEELAVSRTRLIISFPNT